MTPLLALSHHVRVSTAHAWRDRETCLLEVSMGNVMHYGERFAAIADWACRNFRHVLVNCADTLNRHNLMATSMDAGGAALAARQMGDFWVAQNEAPLRGILQKGRIIRWDEWLLHTDYPVLHDGVCRHFQTDSGFREAVLGDATTFVQRTLADDEARQAAVLAHSIDYLLEEAAVYALSARLHRPLRCYPATELRTMAHLARPETPSDIAGMSEAVYGRLVLRRRRLGVDYPQSSFETCREN